MRACALVSQLGGSELGESRKSMTKDAGFSSDVIDSQRVPPFLVISWRFLGHQIREMM